MFRSDLKGMDSVGWPRRGYAWYVVVVLTAAYAVAYLDRVVLGLLLEPIANDLKISDTQVSLLGGAAFAIFYITMGLPLGRLADRVNRRNLIAMGVACWSCMTVFCGLAGSFWQLFFARVGIGIGEAALTPAAHSLISDYFPPRRRGAPLSTYMIGLAFGSGLAFMGGGAVIQWISSIPHFSLPLLGELKPWQATFVIAGLPGFVLVLLMASIREPVRRERLVETAGAAAAIPLRKVLNFILRENGRTFATIFLAFAGLTLHATALQLWLPAYFSRSFGWSAQQIGIAYGAITLSCATAGMIGGAQLASRLLARGHADALMRAPVIMGLFLTPVSIAATLMPTPALTLWLVAPVTILSFGVMALVPGILQSITPNEMRGQVTAIFSFFNNLVALMLGGTIVALFTDFLFRNEQALGQSLALTALLFLPISTFLLWRGLPHFRQSLVQADAWKQVATA